MIDVESGMIREPENQTGPHIRFAPNRVPTGYPVLPASAGSILF